MKKRKSLMIKMTIKVSELKRTRSNSLALCFFSCVFALLTGIPLYSQNVSAPTYFDRGLEAQNDEKWYLASQHFLEAINENPAYYDAYLHLAQCSYQLGEFELCLDQLLLAEKYAKDSSDVNNLRGMTYIALGEFSEARGIFERVLKKAPNNVDAHFGLAELDLFDGRITGAEKQYAEVLKRQTLNRKALLSLALVSAELKKFDKAEHYVRQALGNYSNEAEVHYLAAMIYAMKNDLSTAEKQCRVAVELDGNYDKAYELLAKVQFEQGVYEEVIPICDFRIGRDRNLTSAWYLKGASEHELGRFEDAITTWTQGLNITPDDEIMRAALEILVNKTVPLEDSRRKNWASYHIASAHECESRYDSVGASYEYQRALKIDPSNEVARMAFAEILELHGMHESYLEQLLFIMQNRALLSENEGADVTTEEGAQSGREVKSVKSKKSFEQTLMDDTIEAYKDLLSDSLAKKWNVEPFYLNKTRWNIGIYYVPSTVNQIHVKNNTIAAEFASDIFTGIASASIATRVAHITGFGDAYQKARSANLDYFIILSIDEAARDITLDYSFYSGRTGNKLFENSLYATANMRYANVFRRFRGEVLERLTVRGKIIARNGKILLSDIGRSENMREGAVFAVVRKNAVRTASKEMGVVYNNDDVLGTFTITTCGEEVSEGTLDFDGFYDRVNTGDELVLVSMPREEDGDVQNGSENLVASAPEATASGEPVSGRTLSSLAAPRRVPSFIDLIRSIY